MGCSCFCVVSQKEIATVEEIAAQADPKAFAIVSDAGEVPGEGVTEGE